MERILRLMVLAVFWGTCAFAGAEVIRPENEPVSDVSAIDAMGPTELFTGWNDYVDSGTGYKLVYRQHSPTAKEGVSYPLVLFFHGAGERGDNNAAQVGTLYDVVPLTKYAMKHGDAFVLAPQCPDGTDLTKYTWAGVDWKVVPMTRNAGPTPQMEAVMKLVREFVRDNPVDPSRVYVTGLSMGGFGTWDIVSRMPGFFAAMMPCCGGADPTTAALYENETIRFFHGASDNIVPCKHSRDMNAALAAAGIDHDYIEYPGVNHVDCWKKVYYDTEENIRWLFGQVLGQVALKTTDELSDLKVDGTTVPGFRPSLHDYAVAGGREITDATAYENMGITILPRDAASDSTYAVTVSEDGFSSVRYAVSLHQHEFDPWVTSAPTCTSDGSRSRTCAGCETVETEILPALGHDWDEGTVLREPTEDEPGLRHVTCRRCGLSEDRAIPNPSKAVAMRNIAMVVEAGSVPALPATVRGFLADGSDAGEHEVAWNLEGCDFSTDSVVVVPGAVRTDETATMPVTASVRVVVPSSGLEVDAALGVVPTAWAKSGIAYQMLSDTTALERLTNGKYENNSFPVGGTPGTSGSFIGKYAKNEVFVFEFALPKAAHVTGFDVWHMTDSNCREHIPGFVEVSKDGGKTWSASAPLSGGARGKVLNVDNIQGGQTGVFPYSYALAAPETGVTNVRFKMSPGAGETIEEPIPMPSTDSKDYTFLKISEIRVLAIEGGTGDITPSADAMLASLAVDGIPIEGFSPTTYEYSVDNGKAITSAAGAGNLGITILPKFGDEICAMTLAEDGVSAKRYVVTTPYVCVHERTTAVGFVAATCTAAGDTGLVTCDACGKTVRDHEPIPPLGHSWGGWSVTKEATMTEAGRREHTCRRPGCGVTEGESLPKLSTVVALRNVAIVTAFGVAPALPTKVAGLRSDGTVGGEYEVSWPEVPAPSATGVTTVTGTATVDGAAMEVTASVRVESATPVNLSPSAIETTEANIITGKIDKPAQKKYLYLTTKAADPLTTGIWDDVICYGNVVEVTLEWNEAVTVDKVKVYFNGTTGNYMAPKNVKFYTGDGFSEEIAWTEGENNDNGGNEAWHEYVFDTPQTFSKLKFYQQADKTNVNKSLFLRRLWVLSAGGSVEPLSSDALSALAVDGVPVAGFAPETLSYSVDNGQAITSATGSDNMGVTVLPKNWRNNAYAVTLAEDGASTKTYTVAMPDDEPPAAGVEVVVTRPDGTEERQTVDIGQLKALILESAYGTKVTLPILTESVELVLAPGVCVKLAPGQDEGVLTFVLPSAWHKRSIGADGVFAALDEAKVTPEAAAIELDADGRVRISVGNAKDGLVYGVRHGATLEALASDAAVEWLGKCGATGELSLQPGGETLGVARFFRIVVSDDPRLLESSVTSEGSGLPRACAAAMPAAGERQDNPPDDDPSGENIVMLRNIATATKVGVAPILPGKVLGLRGDGTAGGAYSVVWSDTSAPTQPGMKTITGTATVGGRSMSVTCSVRVVD